MTTETYPTCKNWKTGIPTTGEMVAVLIEGMVYPEIARYDHKHSEWIYEGYDHRIVQGKFKVAYYHFLDSPPSPFSL